MKEATDNSVDIITKSTEAPGVFVFGDLVENSFVKALDTVHQSEQIALLNLFRYGTYDDYKKSPTTYPPLTPAQVRKLRQLTIISMCYAQRLIPYDRLLTKLEIPSLRELEDLIIDLFYLEAISGKLDQQKGLLVVESTIGRDLHEDELPKLRAALDRWCGCVDGVINDLAEGMGKATQQKQIWDKSRAAIASKLGKLNKDSLLDAEKADAESCQMDVDDLLGHPDILTDGSSHPFLRTGVSTASPQAGDKDQRGRKNILLGLKQGRKGK